MSVERIGVALVLAAGMAVLPGCAVENGGESAAGTGQKGGDERNGEYTATANWWKPAPDHRRGMGLGSGLWRCGGHSGPDHRGRVGRP